MHIVLMESIIKPRNITLQASKSHQLLVHDIDHEKMTAGRFKREPQERIKKMQ